jgi:hypothetical protein
MFRNHVIPARGIQQSLKNLDTGFRRCGAAGYNLAPETYSQRTSCSPLSSQSRFGFLDILFANVRELKPPVR